MSNYKRLYEHNKIRDMDTLYEKAAAAAETVIDAARQMEEEIYKTYNIKVKARLFISSEMENFIFVENESREEIYRGTLSDNTDKLRSSLERQAGFEKVMKSN